MAHVDSSEAVSVVWPRWTCCAPGRRQRRHHPGRPQRPVLHGLRQALGSRRHPPARPGDHPALPARRPGRALRPGGRHRHRSGGPPGGDLGRHLRGRCPARRPGRAEHPAHRQLLQAPGAHDLYDAASLPAMHRAIDTIESGRVLVALQASRPSARRRRSRPCSWSTRYCDGEACASRSRFRSPPSSP